jgi:hypothetical protein
MARRFDLMSEKCVICQHAFTKQDPTTHRTRLYGGEVVHTECANTLEYRAEGQVQPPRTSSRSFGDLRDLDFDDRLPLCFD